MRPVLRRLAIIAFPALILLLPSSATAFPLTNCALDLTSATGRLMTIDTATAGGADSTQTDPFQVDWDGTVQWTGTTGTQVIKDSSWGVSVFGIPTPLSGNETNEEGTVDGDGTVDVGVNLPFRVTGLFFVSGSISGTGGSCAGSGWMRLIGDPFGTTLFWLGLILILLGLLALWRGYLGSAVLAILGGLLLGLGGAMMLVIYALMFVGEWTPLAALLVGILIGVLTAVYRRRPVVVTTA
jgi:hypothetical protein